MLEFCGARAGDRALDVGAGTGKATALFAGRGLAVLALEPSGAMARVARQRLATRPAVSIEETDFEQWRVEASAFRLVFSAQAWHWVKPDLGYVRAAEALLPSGALAVFWSRPLWAQSPLGDELDRVYSEVVPDFGIRPGPMHPSAHPSAQWMTDWDPDLSQRAGFAPPEARAYSWRAMYTTDQYLELLQTHSDHSTLPPDRLDALLRAVGSVLDRHGGGFDLQYTTRLIMARLRDGPG